MRLSSKEERREPSWQTSERWKGEVDVEVDEATVNEYIIKKDKEKKSLLSRGEGSDQFR